ncbi:MAG: peptide deformylase [Patescibacteria group bacterium]
MILDLLPTSDPRLRQTSEDISMEELLRPETQKFIDDMIETMKAQRNSESNPVGLAAVQVGVNKRIIVVDHNGRNPRVFINARMSGLSPGIVDSPEGCYSVIGTWGVLKRHKKGNVKALDREGNKVSFKVSGFEAIVFQHEIDHTDGTLFIDHADVEITKTALQHPDHS